MLAALIASIALGTAPVAAVPPPPVQVGASCDGSAYASDVLVCADPDLRSLDARMLEAWAASDFATVVAQGAWIEPQDAWFRRRSLCAFAERHAECLQAAYAERIAVLEALRRVARRPLRRGLEASCVGAPWESTVAWIRAPEAGALTIEDVDARVFAAATPPGGDAAWSPYMVFEMEGAAIRLTTIEGSTIVCTFVVPR